MPWVLGKHAGSQVYKEYRELTVADLRERLVRRGLPYSGKKAALVSRLTDNNDAHPFPFMRLPPEIRNKIYRLTATTHRFSRLDRYYFKKYRPNGLKNIRDQTTIVQPGLVCCSKQTRSEGLLIFFRHHHFWFDFQHLGHMFGDRSLKDLLPWLNKIGTVERTNIRNITLIRNISPCDVPVMHLIHARLSNEATIIYESPYGSHWPEHVTSMLEIVRRFQPWTSAKVLSSTRSQGIAVSLRSSSGRLSFDEGPSSLTILPGLLRFGKKHEVGVQAKIQEEEVET